jgi:hypothetical protein
VSTGNAGLVLDTISRGNTGHGIAVGATSLIVDSIADTNTGNGIYAQFGATVRRCSANANRFSGMDMGGQFSSLVTDSIANLNEDYGISVNAGSLVLRSTTNNNGVHGVRGTNGTSGLGFLTSNGNPFGAVIDFVSTLACSVFAAVQSCPP